LAPATAITVELRGTGKAQLRAIVRKGLPLLAIELARHERTVPDFVSREFQDYPSCGDPAVGFAWLECFDCQQRRLVLFSRKPRGFWVALGHGRPAPPRSVPVHRVRCPGSVGGCSVLSVPLGELREQTSRGEASLRQGLPSVHEAPPVEDPLLDALDQVLRAEITAIEVALTRLDDGVYGLCTMSDGGTLPGLCPLSD
jgi:hypothetical protein